MPASEQPPTHSLKETILAMKNDRRKDHEKGVSISFLQLFRYCDRLEICYIILATIAAMVHGAALPLFVVLFGSVVDSFREYQDPGGKAKLVENVGPLARLFLVIGVVALVTTAIQVRFASVAALRLSNRLRRLYFKSLLTQDMTWHDSVETGALTARVTLDVDLFEDGVGAKYVSAVQNLTTSVFGIIIAFIHSWKLTLVVFSTAPFVACCFALIAKVSARRVSATQEAYATAGAIATEAFSLIRTVTAFNGQETEAKRYEAKLQSAYLSYVQFSLYRGLAGGLNGFVFFSSFAIAFIYGASLVRSNEIVGGDVVVAFFGVYFAMMSLGQATPAFTAIAVARVAALKLYEVIQRTSEIDSLNDEGGIKPDSCHGELKFENVNFNYPTRRIDSELEEKPYVLNDFNLDVRPGRSHALVGPSGCGKSTTVRLIERFYDVSDGKLLLDGIDVREYNVQWLRSQIGYVGQMPTLFMLSIHDNIALGGSDFEKVTKEEVVEAAKMANAHDFIMRLPQQYATMLGERGALLSGGQKQRICIARALVRNPKILLLDESTSALDAQSERHVQEALEKASEGRTTVTIAHRLSTVRNADTISLIDGGKVREQGTHDELMSLGGAYKTLVENQNIAALKFEKESQGVSQAGVSTSMMISDDSLTMGRSTSKGKGESDGESDENGEKENKEKVIDPGIVMRTLKFSFTEVPFIALGMLGAALAGATLPLMSIPFSSVLSDILNENSKELIRRSAITFVLIGCMSFTGHSLFHSMLGVSGGRLTRKARVAMFRTLLNQDIGFFDQKINSVGQLTTRLVSETSLMQGLTGETLGSGTYVCSALLTGLLVAYLSCWEVALVVTLFLPLMALSKTMQTRMVAVADANSGSKFASAGAVASEAIDNLDAVASLGIQPYFINRYEEELKAPLLLGRRKAVISGIMFGLAEFLQQALWAVSFWVGSIFVKNDRCEFSNLLRGIAGLLFAGTSLGHLSQFMPDIPKSKVAATKVFRLLDRAPDMTNGEKKTSTEEMSGEIHASGLQFEYPTRRNVPVLRGLSLKAKSGQTVALVGASGCGKSTIIALLQRFYDAHSGQILVDGTGTQQYEVSNLRSHFGLVNQEPDLFNRTVRENIEYGLLGGSDGNPVVITDGMVEEAAKEANCHDFIMNLPDKYETVVGPRGDRLSGGQRQRVAIARTLIRRPKILLLDEATSALDSVSEQVVQRALNKASSGRTTIAIAHRLSTVRDADVIYVIEGGRVIERGNHVTLMAKNGAYAALVENQTDQIDS